MKILIWTGCILALAVSMTIMKRSGVIVGALPAMLMFGGMWFIGTSLSRWWDSKSKKNKSDESKNQEKEK